MQQAREFWNKEYAHVRNFESSRNWKPSSELLELEIYLKKHQISPNGWKTLDLACGNGRNSIYMLKNWNVAKTIGIDFAEVPLEYFKDKATEESLTSRVKIFEQTIGKTFPIPDESIDLALDIYGSINLRADGRTNCKDETYRVLKRGGLFITYLTSRDSGFVKEMIDCTQGPEPDSVIFNNGKFEKVFSEEEIKGFYKDFEIAKLKKHNFTVDKYPVEMFWVLLRR